MVAAESRFFWPPLKFVGMMYTCPNSRWEREQREHLSAAPAPRARVRAYCAENATSPRAISNDDCASAVSTLAILSNGNAGVAQFVVPFLGATKVSLGADRRGARCAGAKPELASSG